MDYIVLVTVSHESGCVCFFHFKWGIGASYLEQTNQKTDTWSSS